MDEFMMKLHKWEINWNDCGLQCYE